MKISVVLPLFPLSAVGGVKVVFEYMNYLVAKGSEVTIYFCKDYCVPIRRIPAFAEKVWRHYIQEKSKIKWFDLDRRIKRKSVERITNESIDDSDVIIATGVNTAKPIAALSSSKGKKFYFIQDFENWGISDEVVYETYRLPFIKIVVSNWLKGIVDAHSDVPSILLSNSIDLRVFHVTTPNSQRAPHTLCFHYRNAEMKGCKYAIEAVRRLEERYADLKVYVVSNGNPPENLPKSCEFLQNLTSAKVAEVNNKAQVFLCTTIDEGFGLPGLEAMACGCALVSTKYTGVLEYAVDGKNAALTPVRDIEKIVQAVCKVFDDGDFRKKIVQQGVQDAKQRDLLCNCKKFEELLMAEVEHRI